MSVLKPPKRKSGLLADGEYLAVCREQTLISAAANGHSLIWPASVLVIDAGNASFFKLNKLVWSCNAGYAATHFDVTPMQAGWFTDSGNRAGTGHYFRVLGNESISACGRVVPVDDLQAESEVLKYCSRCLKSKPRD